MANSEIFETVIPEGKRASDFPDLPTKEQVAELLGVTAKCISGWVAHKKIPHIKICGSLLRFRRSEIIEYINNLPTRGGPHA